MHEALKDFTDKSPWRDGQGWQDGTCTRLLKTSLINPHGGMVKVEVQDGACTRLLKTSLINPHGGMVKVEVQDGACTRLTEQLNVAKYHNRQQ